MSIDWIEIQKALSPIKNYTDLCRRWHESLRYSLVCAVFNFTLLDWDPKL